MIKVKVCGMRNFNDINYLNLNLPDYAGFIFAESKRKLTVEKAAELIKKMDRRISKVGVFVNESINNIVNINKVLNLNVIQLHGDESHDYIEELRKEITNIHVWKGFRIIGEESIPEILNYKNVDAYLLDAYSKDSYGGTGKAFDWTIAAKIKKIGKIILAGGLNCDNIEEAIEKVGPYAVDVSSGVEIGNGKDEYKVKKFIYKVRNYTY